MYFASERTAEEELCLGPKSVQVPGGTTTARTVPAHFVFNLLSDSQEMFNLKIHFLNCSIFFLRALYANNRRVDWRQRAQSIERAKLWWRRWDRRVLTRFRLRSNFLGINPHKRAESHTLRGLFRFLSNQGQSFQNEINFLDQQRGSSLRSGWRFQWIERRIASKCLSFQDIQSRKMEEYLEEQLRLRSGMPQRH